MKLVIRTLERIVNAGGYLAGWLVFLLMWLVSVEVFMRYVLNRPPMVADEFGGYLMVAIGFLALGYTWAEKGHIRITVLVGLLPQRVASWVRLITLVSVFAFVIMLTGTSYEYLAYSFSAGLKSPSVWRFPLQGPQMVIPIGYTLICLLIALTLAQAIMDIRSGRNIAGEGRQ